MLNSRRRDLPSALWLLWLAAATAFTANAAWWQISYFRLHGPRLYHVLPILLPCSILALTFYLRLRRRSLWRYEPVVVAGALAVALLVYAFLAALVIVWMLTACYALGRRLLRVLQLEPGPPQRSIPICASIGFAALDAALFPFGPCAPLSMVVIRSPAGGMLHSSLPRCPGAAGGSRRSVETMDGDGGIPRARRRNRCGLGCGSTRARRYSSADAQHCIRCDSHAPAVGALVHGTRSARARSRS